MDEYISKLLSEFKSRNRRIEYELRSPLLEQSQTGSNSELSKSSESNTADDCIRRSTTIRATGRTSVLRYNLHKRSLPPGLDQIIAVDVTKEDIELLKKRAKNHFEAVVLPDDTVIYYDLIPIDATPEQKSIYYNDPKRIIQGEI